MKHLVEKYTKKPVTIEAVQLTTENIQDVLTWCNHSDIIAEANDNGVSIRTLEGAMQANFNAFVIKGVKGEFYPCKPEIFLATYDKANSLEDADVVVLKENAYNVADWLSCDTSLTKIEVDNEEQHLCLTGPQGVFFVDYGMTLSRKNGVYSVHNNLNVEGETNGQ